jgi:hypothetical protein
MQTDEPVEANRVDDLSGCSPRSFLNLLSFMPGVQESSLFWLSRRMLPARSHSGSLDGTHARWFRYS